MVSNSNFQCVESSNSSNLQTFKLPNFLTFNISNIRTLRLSKLSNFRSLENFKPSTPESLKLCELSIFEAFKLSNFQISWVSKFQTPRSQTFELEPEGCSVSLYASPAVLRVAPSCNARCRGFKLPSWIPLQTFKLQTQAHFQTRYFQTLQSCPTCNTFKLSKIRVRKNPLVTPIVLI